MKNSDETNCTNETNDRTITKEVEYHLRDGNGDELIEWIEWEW